MLNIFEYRSIPKEKLGSLKESNNSVPQMGAYFTAEKKL